MPSHLSGRFPCPLVPPICCIEVVESQSPVHRPSSHLSRALTYHLRPSAREFISLSHGPETHLMSDHPGTWRLHPLDMGTADTHTLCHWCHPERISLPRTSRFFARILLASGSIDIHRDGLTLIGNPRAQSRSPDPQTHAIMSTSTSTLPPDIFWTSGIPFPFDLELQRINSSQVLGYMLNWCLFGVVSIQVYYYYMAFPKDRLYCKCLVYGVYILETLQTGVITHDAFASFGLGFGSFDALDSIQFTCLSIPILSGVVGCVVQVFYAYRINMLSKTKTLGYVIAVISVIGCVAGIVTGVKSFQIGRLSRLTETPVFISAAFWWGCCAICDVTIALSMIYLLSRHDTGFRSTHLMITRLTRIIVETGTATALVAIVNLILFFRYPKTNYYTVPVLIIAKLYCNTLLVLFNHRMRITGGREEDLIALNTIEIPTRIPSVTFSRPPSAYHEEWKPSRKDGGVQWRDALSAENQNYRQTHPEVGIRVSTDVFVTKDSDSIDTQPTPPSSGATSSADNRV
ncbi:hypothetical protein Hypma_013182 [Hypsizygus marmoreus]|uniref:DUF6534 domain-containing protein n=1 Tax=Hypsizygus marmoreus TaxID=39966 RepID=A0A369JEM2_HYPMA|nr:hypothetical protein Hypma_013182 [Hypsizygus marmoreus]